MRPLFHSDMLVLFHTALTFMRTVESNLQLHPLFLLFCHFCFLKITRTTMPQHKATSSIPKAIPATLGVVSPMPHFANGKKRKLTLQSDRQKQKWTKATSSHIEGSTTQITSASTPIAAMQTSLAPPNTASILILPSPSVISISIHSAMNLSHLRGPHPSSSALQLITSSLLNKPSCLSVRSKRYGS